jgi:DNA invertase Pin-like site-specific DNA recombinase
MIQLNSEEYVVGLYLRLSRDDNNGNSESVSIENQRDLLVGYANERGWKIREVYIDDGYSGTTFERPAFQRMKIDIEKGRINMVITKDLSRLGRNYAQTGYYMEEYFLEHNVRYIAINDDVDTTKDNDIVPFKNVLNEFYAKDISKKIRTVRLKNAKQGKFQGSKAPYGYIKSSENKHLLLVDKEAADIIRRIFSCFAGGDSSRSIAVKLNNEGRPSPREYYYQSIDKQNPKANDKKVWGSTTVLQLLKNPVYIGNMVQGKRVSPSFKSKKRNVVPESLWIVNENTHEPIVDKDTWDAVCKRFNEKKRSRPNSTGEVSLFSGIARCADCGSPLTFTHKCYSGREYFLYRCSRYNNNGKSTCSIHSISLEKLENIVLEDIKNNAKILNDDEIVLMDRLLKLSNSENNKLIAEHNTQLISKQNRLAEVNNLTFNCFEEKSNGNLSENMFKKLLSKYEEEEKILTLEIDNLKKYIDSTKVETTNIESLVKNFKSYINISKLDRYIVCELIDSISVSEQYKIDGQVRQDIKINYKFVGCLKNFKLCS